MRTSSKNDQTIWNIELSWTIVTDTLNRKSKSNYRRSLTAGNKDSEIYYNLFQEQREIYILKGKIILY